MHSSKDATDAINHKKINRCSAVILQQQSCFAASTDSFRYWRSSGPFCLLLLLLYPASTAIYGQKQCAITWWKSIAPPPPLFVFILFHFFFFLQRFASRQDGNQDSVSPVTRGVHSDWAAPDRRQHRVQLGNGACLCPPNRIQPDWQ